MIRDEAEEDEGEEDAEYDGFGPQSVQSYGYRPNPAEVLQAARAASTAAASAAASARSFLSDSFLLANHSNSSSAAAPHFEISNPPAPSMTRYSDIFRPQQSTATPIRSITTSHSIANLGWSHAPVISATGAQLGSMHLPQPMMGSGNGGNSNSHSSEEASSASSVPVPYSAASYLAAQSASNHYASAYDLPLLSQLSHAAPSMAAAAAASVNSIAEADAAGVWAPHSSCGVQSSAAAIGDPYSAIPQTPATSQWEGKL